MSPVRPAGSQGSLGVDGARVGATEPKDRAKPSAALETLVEHLPTSTPYLRGARQVALEALAHLASPHARTGSEAVLAELNALAREARNDSIPSRLPDLVCNTLLLLHEWPAHQAFPASLLEVLHRAPTMGGVQQSRLCHALFEAGEGRSPTESSLTADRAWKAWERAAPWTNAAR